MTSPMFVAVGLLAVHFVADFLMQSHWMSLNKSKRWDALALHGLAYTGTTFLLTLLWAEWWWALANGLAHVAVDAVTSRITSRLYAKGKIHWFFVVIGVDQLIHAACLLLSWRTP